MVIDLKIGSFTHARRRADALLPELRAGALGAGGRENPPVGLILCSEKDDALARYALKGCRAR